MNLKLAVSSVLVLSIFISCNRSALSKKLSGCDSLIVTFNAGNTDSVKKIVSTTNTKAIQKVAGFLKGNERPLYKCGYDGSMIFFRNGRQVLPVVFKYSEPGCKHFSFDLDNKVISTDMKNEAIRFLESLASGKNGY